MKKTISVVLQTILLLLANMAGLILQPFHKTQIIASNVPGVTHTFVWDGILSMLVIYVLIVIVEAARKRLPSSAIWSTVALIVALIVGRIAGCGFKTV
jgi:hypothetical protein